MKKITKNRKVIGLSCVIISLITCFVLAPAIIRKEEEKVEVIRVKDSIDEGDIITLENLEKLEVYNKNIPSNMVLFTDIDTVVGTYATTDIFNNETLLNEHTTQNNMSKYSYLDELNANNLAVSIYIGSFEKGLSDKLEAGDVVRVFATNYNDESLVSPQELQYVKVLAVTEESGFDNDEVSSEEYETTLSVTLQGNDIQIRKIVDLNANSDIHLALVYRGIDENANKLLELQGSMIGGN